MAAVLRRRSVSALCALTRACAVLWGSSTATGEVLYELKGRWAERVLVRDVATGEERVLLDATSPIGAFTSLEDSAEDVVTCEPITVPKPLPLPVSLMGDEACDSRRVWARLTAALHARDWEAARAEKTEVEEAQRALRRSREQAGVVWTPRFFRAAADGDITSWVLKPGINAALALAMETHGNQAAADSLDSPFTPESHKL